MNVNSNILSLRSMLPANYGAVVSANKTYVGIDFGTSTTVVSIASFDKTTLTMTVEPIRLDQILEDGTRHESEMLPSVIAWYHNKLLVGEGASSLKYVLEKGKNIWFSFKMEIGEDLGAKYYNSEVADIEQIRIRNPKDCVRIFFLYLKMLITNYCKKKNISTNISYAVSIPASFEANQRKELLEALETNGMTLSKQSLIDEPNAAFISYVHDSQLTEKPLLISPHYNSKCMVFDFGGGTCDISILEIGKAANGLYSKNIAISKFARMGGDDVDRYITYKYIMPRFLEANGHKSTDFRTRELQYVATQLYKVAERLKILISKKVANQMYNFEIAPSLKNSSDKESISIHVEIDTLKGTLQQDTFYLTTKELVDTMEVFMRNSNLPTNVKGQEEYNNIFIPINSAIKKAGIREEELDYVLLIGGSAQNPFIQETLKKSFADSELLVPQNLQTHVSKGAAIHSLLMNGMNKCIIQPITSEPIMAITRDSSPRMLMPAGSMIPSDTIVIDDLVTSRDKQKTIEIPLCVGNANKILHVLQITHPGTGFPVNSPVKVVVEINADKVLLAQASCMGLSCAVTPQNPFANKELSTEERIVLVAERQANLEAEQNGGMPSKQSLIKLKDAYLKAGNDFRAAETFEQMNEMYPTPNEFNSIGVLYHNSGNYEKAIGFFERAIANNPNDFHPTFNLGNTLSCMGSQHRKRSEEYIRKAFSMRPEYCPVLIEMADIEQRNGNSNKAREYRRKAYDILYQRWMTNSLSEYEYSWLSNVADSIGERSVASEVRRSKPGVEQEQYFNTDNLTRTKINSIEKI